VQNVYKFLQTEAVCKKETESETDRLCSFNTIQPFSSAYASDRLWFVNV